MLTCSTLLCDMLATLSAPKNPYIMGIKRFKMLIYSYVNCVFSPIRNLSRTHLRGFKADSDTAK